MAKLCEILKALFSLVFLITRGEIASGRNDDWPLDCLSNNIDLVLVSDSASATSDAYNRQMMFFSQVLDVFLLPAEVLLQRVKVSLVTSTLNLTSESATPTITVNIKFDAFQNRNELKRAIDNSTAAITSESYPLQTVLQILQTIFNGTDSGTRPDAIHAIVMIVQNGNLQETEDIDIELLRTISTEMNVQLFFVLVGSDTDTKLGFSRRGHVLVESLSDLTQIQYIPLYLCKRCFTGWFAASGNLSRPNDVSCYRLFSNTKDVSWVDANEKCKAESAELVSIETPHELEFLRETIPNEVATLVHAANTTFSAISIYIGLRRRSSSLGQRFRWLSRMPLTYSHWNRSQPQGGNTIGCTRWNFPAEGTNHSLTVLRYTTDLEDGWSSVGCGSTISPFYLCESPNVLRGFRSPAGNKRVTLAKPSQESLRGAIRRGELAYSPEFTTVHAVSAFLSLNRNVHSQTLAYVSGQMDKVVRLDLIDLFWCDNFTHIPYTWVCDYSKNCSKYGDELNCGYRECNTRNEFKCDSSQCVPIEAKCDLYPDCTDGSDELDCIMCPHGRCSNARCLPKHWFADGEIDCDSCQYEGSIADEATAIEDHSFAQCAFICNRTQCVYISMLNDSVLNCQGPEGPLDETIGSLVSTMCYSSEDNLTAQYTNWAPKCIYFKDRYGEPIGCRDMSHLRECKRFKCPDGYYKCPDSYCIPVHYLKNSENDCAKGDDEGEFILECPGHFRCMSSSICLHPNLVCDRHPHCPRGDDEMNCNVSCREGFLCIGGVVKSQDYNKAVPLENIDFLDPRTRYLDLSGINVSAFIPMFPKERLGNLVNLSLSGCSVTTLERNQASTYYKELRSIWWLDMSYNLIDNLHRRNILRSMFKLQFLNLSHNERLTSMHGESFTPFYNHLSVIRVLDLSFTGLTAIGSSVLTPLKQLERLSLRNAHIVNIAPDTFPLGFELNILDLRGLALNDLYPAMFKNVTIQTRLLTDSFKLCCPQIHNENTKTSACVASKDPFSSCADLMNEVILRILLWVSGILAVAGNITVIIYRVFFNRAILKMAYGHFVTHLGFSDFLMGLYLIIIATADYYYRDTYVWNEFSWRHSSACEVAGFISTLSSETSTLFIALITLDRFLTVKFPFRQIKLSGKVTTLCCALTWAAGFLIASVPMLPYFRYWELYSNNGMCLGLPLTNKRFPGWQFAAGVFIVFNFFLFIMIAFGQVAIYRSLSASRMDQTKCVNTISRRSQDQAVAKNLSLVVITDFIFWFPICVMGLLALSGYEIGTEAYAWSAVVILPINSAINPLLYTIPAVVHSLKRYRSEATSNQLTKTQM